MNSKRILSVLFCLIFMLTACVPQNTASETKQTEDNAVSSSVTRVTAPTSSANESSNASSSAVTSSGSASKKESSSNSAGTTSSKKPDSSSSVSSKTVSSNAVSSKQEDTPSADDDALPYYSPYRYEEYYTSPEYSAAFYCIEDGEFLLSENMDHRSCPASITKLVTACTAMRYLSENDTVEVGTEQCLVTYGLTRCGLKIGMKMSVEELMYCMLLPSGADAAYTAAVSTARKVYPDEELDDHEAVDRFVEMMNDFVKSIGMEDSHFVSPEGRDYEEQYVTAHDLTLLGKYALSVPVIRKVVGTFRYGLEGTGIVCTSTNRMLNPYDFVYNSHAIGLKTGTTSSAGYCLLSAFSDNGKTYISAVLGAGPNVYEITLGNAAKFLGNEYSIGGETGDGTDSQTENPDESQAEYESESETEGISDPVSDEETGIIPEDNEQA